MNIYQKLAEARKIIRETKEKKGGHNSYSNYDYFTPEQVEGLVADACVKTETICLTSFKADAFGYYQLLTFMSLENPEEKIDFELRTERGDIKATNVSQQMGGTDTYSERYAKMKVFQIKDNNLDFDSQDNRVASQNLDKPFKTNPYIKGKKPQTDGQIDRKGEAELNISDLND